ncbi:Elongation factor 1-beta [Candidatus Anstonella stagnisolia]|nr:Elongation factor 1-beta [Candidatus Anstonella stagnisolia]
MGKVAVEMKILPENMDNFEALKKKIFDTLAPSKISEEPIAFGLKAITLLIIIDDAPGGSDSLEEKASKIQGVSQVEITSVDRL